MNTNNKVNTKSARPTLNYDGDDRMLDMIHDEAFEHPPLDDFIDEPVEGNDAPLEDKGTSNDDVLNFYEMFPEWERAALDVVLDACGGDAAQAANRVLTMANASTAATAAAPETTASTAAAAEKSADAAGSDDESWDAMSSASSVWELVGSYRDAAMAAAPESTAACDTPRWYSEDGARRTAAVAAKARAEAARALQKAAALRPVSEDVVCCSLGSFADDAPPVGDAALQYARRTRKTRQSAVCRTVRMAQKARAAPAS